MELCRVRTHCPLARRLTLIRGRRQHGVHARQAPLTARELGVLAPTPHAQEAHKPEQ